MNYEYYLIKADSDGYEVREVPLRSSRGRVNGNVIGIRSSMTEQEKKCTLVEELAHQKYTVGNILDGSNPASRKQEYLARLSTYRELASLEFICQAFEHGCRAPLEFSEYLDITEDILQDALNAYAQKYEYCYVGEYTVIFHPYFTVLKRI